MSARTSTAARLCLAALVLAAIPCAHARADTKLDALLRERGLHRLRFVDLERRLERAPSAASKGLLAREMANELLAMARDATDAASAGALRTRVEKLRQEHGLRDAEDDDILLGVLGCEFALARGEFLGVLLRGAPQEPLEQCRGRMESLGAALRALGERVERGERTDRRRYDASDDSGEVADRRERMDRRSEQASQLASMEGWSLVARAWLGRRLGASDSTMLASQSMEHWGSVLGIDSQCSDRESVSRDLRGNRAYAEAILGAAMAKSMAGGGWLAAEPWLALLEDPATAPELLRQLPYWRMVIALDGGAWTAAGDLVERISGQDDAAVPLMVAARTAIGAASSSPEAEDLATRAVAALAAVGDWSAIAALPAPEGVAPGSFLASALRGVALYGRSRTAEGEEGRTLRRNAALAIAAARDAPGARRFPKASASLAELAGWCLRELGEPKAAASQFGWAKESGSDAVGVRAACMEIQCLLEADPAANAAVVRQLREEFLRTHPDAPERFGMLVDLASSEPRMAEDLLTQLLAVPPQAPAAHDAWRAAARVLYKRFVDAKGDARGVAGRELLEVPVPAASAWPNGSVDSILRMQLDAALDEAVLDLGRARALLDRVPTDALAPTARAEIDLRRGQLALHEGRFEVALAALGGIPKSDPSFRALERWLLHHVSRRLERGEAVAPAVLDAAVAAAQLGGGGTALARLQLAKARGGDREAAVDAVRLLAPEADATGAAYPVLRDAADAALLAGDDLATRRWLARLSSALDPASAEGARARFELATLLVRVDPKAAEQLLQQQRAMVPGFGPAPWGERMRALADGNWR